jgi:hypothetical protein
MYLSMNFVFFHLTVLDNWEIDYYERGGYVRRITGPGANFPEGYIYPAYERDDMTDEDYKEYLRSAIMTNADADVVSQGSTKQELESGQEELLTQMVDKTNEPSTADFSDLSGLEYLQGIARDITEYLR